MIKRCKWVDPTDSLMVSYHDLEWGQPVFDDRLLFEMLILEGAQAGLSWKTVLHKRLAYKNAFDDFDVDKISLYSTSKIDVFMQNAGLIRHRKKLESVIQNAKAFQKIQTEFESFSKYLWGFVNSQPVVRQTVEIISRSELSDTISKDLKKRGMNFVGSTIIYAYLQAVGVINDHDENCFCKVRS